MKGNQTPKREAMEVERTMSIEEKIRRAEEIYAKRQGNNQRRTATVTVNNKERKDIKLLKKLIIQIVVCLLIYLVIYTIQNNSYVFSEDFINKANYILSYDMNFGEMYESLKQNIQNEMNNLQNNNLGIGGGTDENTTNEESVIEPPAEEQTTDESIEENTQTDNEETQVENLSQEEQDIQNIKATTTFIKPVEGTISSRYGTREPTTSTVPKNHTGIDIAANLGTKIVSATDGEVVLASEEGDYGKHLKVQIGDVSIVYAHCNSLYVGQGDKVTQGQEIAEVGSTGNSTGPHLHFEIRISERTIDPEKILEF